MQKYILFICSVVLFPCSLSAQLKEKVASLTGSLNNVQKLISKPSSPPGLPAIDVETTKKFLYFIFRGWIDTPESLKDHLMEEEYNVTITQAQELYAKWKSKIEKQSITKLLLSTLGGSGASLEEIEKIANGIESGLIKSAKDLQDTLKRDEYLVTLEQAQKFYEEMKLKLLQAGLPPIPSTLPPPLPAKTPSTSSTPKRPRTPRTRPVEVTAVAAIEALNNAGKKFKSRIQIIDFLNSKKLYPTIPKEIEELENQLARFIG